MDIRKAIVRVSRWIASEKGFSQLSPEAQRAAWSLAGITHVVVLLATFGLVAAMPALTASPRDIVITHFLIGLLAAKLVETVSAMRELFKLPPLWLVSSGWLFAFAVTLQPLLLLAFVMWALG